MVGDQAHDYGRMWGVAEHVRELGGIARTCELYELGVWQTDLQFAKQYREVIHVRRGWWALPETPVLAIAARRAGGRLACVSALEFYGEARSNGLHVALDRSARHPREPHVVSHWSRDRLPGSRLAVSMEVAREQAAKCPYNQSLFLNER